MTSGFSQFAQNISSLLKNYGSKQDYNLQQIKNIILSFEPKNQEQIAKLNVFLQRQIKCTLMSIMNNNNLSKLAQLISLVCELSLQHKQQKNRANYIKQSLAIIIIQDVLQCLGINDLKVILPTISEKVSSFKHLQSNDQNRLLRVINYLLKRISKTEDYLIRGQLQFTLTKILSICHDSGFHYKFSTSKGIEIQESQQNEYQNIFTSEDITYQFYKDFWSLQKYLMDPNELTQQNKSTNQQTQKKGLSNYKSDPLLLLRLRQIEKILGDIVNYMNKHSCTQNPTSLLNQPIKFLTNTHLLQFQLSDQYFRKIILAQVLIFTFTLKHLKPTGNILKGVMLTELQRQTINKIQQIAQKQLQLLEKSMNKDISTNQILPTSITQMIKYFFTSELQWIQLKDHWKQKKKAFLRLDSLIPENQQNNNKAKQPVDYRKKISEVNDKIRSQMNIGGDTLLKFLLEPCAPHIVTTPTQTSFAYYWSQGKSCLNGFDFESCQQHEFQSKSQYNMFEWKALRSFYRQNLTQISIVDKNPKLREYKALGIIEKKQKMIRQNQAKSLEQNTLVNGIKQDNPEVNGQNIQNNIKVETEQKKNNIAEINQIENLDQLKKKIKPNE